jgi:hypothetical protein
MKAKMILISRILAVLGVLLALYALVGRFVGGPAICSYLIPGGVSAGTGALGANTLLLLAILAHAYAGNPPGPADAGAPKN